ncbi:MAG TPA: polysaccharide biosynthesis/export family protein [Bryobacteraceae bacterium]|nr:polysaccharide biosynthesis/export family protein [Bryobacteraceae bacterium]
MRTAILSALLAAFSLSSFAGDDPKVKPQAEQAPAQSPKATIPAALPADAVGKSMVSAAPETDPIKMAAPADGTKPPVTTPFDKSYVIGAEDQLSVNVWGNAALTGTFIVAPDGRISFPLINEVLAAGLTREQLQIEIVRRLKEGGYLRDPTVTVNVTGFNSKKYSIQGEVNKPGSSPLVVPTTVLEALVNAGGFRDFANKSHIRILRGAKVYNFNYNQVINGKHREQNILLEPGDLIIVK